MTTAPSLRTYATAPLGTAAPLDALGTVVAPDDVGAVVVDGAMPWARAESGAVRPMIAMATTATATEAPARAHPGRRRRARLVGVVRAGVPMPRETLPVVPGRRPTRG